MKLGFEKVGLLPSERPSLEAATKELVNNGGMAISEAMKKPVHEVKGVSASHSLDTELDVSGATQADEVSKIEDNEENAREEHVSKKSMKSRLAIHRDEHAAAVVDVDTSPSSPVLEPANTKAMPAVNKEYEPTCMFEGPEHQLIGAPAHCK